MKKNRNHFFAGSKPRVCIGDKDGGICEQSIRVTY